MKKISFMLVSIALVLGLLAGCGGGEAARQPSNSPAPAGSAQPEPGGTSGALGVLASFSAGTLDGGVFTQDDIKDKDVTVINFWALSCAPCIAELPDLAEFSESLPDNVQLVTVCLDGGSNEDTAKEVLAQAGFEGVTLISGDGDLAALAGNLMYTPTTVFADSEGNLVGDAMIGRQEDLSGTYLAAVNEVLAAGGKDAISLEA